MENSFECRKVSPRFQDHDSDSFAPYKKTQQAVTSKETETKVSCEIFTNESDLHDTKQDINVNWVWVCCNIY